MPKVTINGKEYDTEKLPKEAVDLINSIFFVENELRKLKIYNAAKTLYSQRLQSVISKLPQEEK